MTNNISVASLIISIIILIMVTIIVIILCYNTNCTQLKNKFLNELICCNDCVDWVLYNVVDYKIITSVQQKMIMMGNVYLGIVDIMDKKSLVLYFFFADISEVLKLYFVHKYFLFPIFFATLLIYSCVNFLLLGWAVPINIALKKIKKNTFYIYLNFNKPEGR